MRAPPIPHIEPERLRKLHDTCLLDSAAEERFDRITRLAQRTFDVPIALVSLVDKDRQWFKSRQGLGVTETPRHVSFCGHTILGEDVFCVEDTFNDPRFDDNPLVLDGPKIRFYAGCPLRTADGYALGTLCVIDDKPRAFSQEDRQTLSDLAQMAAQEIQRTQPDTELAPQESMQR